MTTANEVAVKTPVESQLVAVAAALTKLEAEIAAIGKKLPEQKYEADATGEYFRNPSPECT